MLLDHVKTPAQEPDVAVAVGAVLVDVDKVLIDVDEVVALLLPEQAVTAIQSPSLLKVAPGVAEDQYFACQM